MPDIKQGARNEAARRQAMQGARGVRGQRDHEARVTAGEAEAEEPMRFRLLAGLHVQADLDKKPAVIGRTINPETGDEELVYKHPSRTYHPGEVVWSTIDLVELHGADKFQRLDLRPGVRGPGATRSAKGHPPRRPRTREEMLAGVEGNEEVLDKRRRGPEGPSAAEIAASPDPETGDEPEQEPHLDFDVERMPTDDGEDPEGGGDEEAQDSGEGQDDGLDSMTVAQLREEARKRQVNLSGATSKQDIVTAMRRGSR